MAKAVKVNVFLTNMGDFAAMNEVYGRHFPDPKPVSNVPSMSIVHCIQAAQPDNMAGLCNERECCKSNYRVKATHLTSQICRKKLLTRSSGTNMCLREGVASGHRCRD